MNIGQRVSTFELEKGRRFVSGLFWQPLVATNPKEVRKEAADHADQMGFSLGVYRRGDTHQVGLASQGDDVRVGDFSVAAMISKTLEIEGHANDALIAVPVGGQDDRWIYFAQRDGVILPDGDFIGTSDEVRAAMHTHYSVSNWSYIVAPSYWSFRDSVERTFRDFLPKTKKQKVAYHDWWALAPINVSSKDVLRKILPSVVLASTLALAAIYGYHTYSVYKKRIAAEQAAKVAAELARQKIAAQPDPWLAQPNPLRFANACIKALGSVSMTPGGWVVKSAKCDLGGTAHIEWTRPPYSTISLLRAVVPSAVIARDGNSAQIDVQIDLADSTRNDQVGPINDAVSWMQDRMQKIGGEIKIDDLPIPVPPEGMPPQSWQAFKWAVTTGMSPDEIAGWLDRPGVRIKNISLSLQDGESTWTMEGLHYAQR